MSKKKKQTEENVENVEQVKTITVRMCEAQNLWVVRDSIELEISEYPELEGKSLEEIKEYIEENWYEMKAPSGIDYADTLSEALEQQDIVREKDTGSDISIRFD